MIGRIDFLPTEDTNREILDVCRALNKRIGKVELAVNKSIELLRDAVAALDEGRWG